MTADNDEENIQIVETQPIDSQSLSVSKRKSIEELELEGEMFLKGLFDKLDTIALFLFSGGVALFSVINYISSKLQSDPEFNPEVQHWSKMSFLARILRRV